MAGGTGRKSETHRTSRVSNMNKESNTPGQTGTYRSRPTPCICYCYYDMMEKITLLLIEQA